MPRDGLTYKERIRAKLFEIQIGRPMTEPVISTVTLMNLPNIGKIVRPPRMIHVGYSLETIFGHAGDEEAQTKILKKAVEGALDGEPESLLVL
ncbi:hypothetical protein AAIG11_08170 [Anoxynatronum sibiricum]|uniref:Uncharacterized protein n=1 Tax=Anoxynatronum sibiricum TaxID=210623 RepID=A0ABU9VWF6_9CLOT